MAEHKDQIKGGLADKKKPSDFNSKALKEGKNVESEHADDKSVAQEIAMDHLTEDKKYYKKLKEIEKKDLLEVTADGKQEIVEGKEALKKEPKAKTPGPLIVPPVNPKDPVLNPGKFPPKAPSEKKQQDYANKIKAYMKKGDEGLEKRWNDLKKGLNNLESIMDLAAASQPEEQQQVDPEMLQEQDNSQPQDQDSDSMQNPHTDEMDENTQPEMEEGGDDRDETAADEQSDDGEELQENDPDYQPEEGSEQGDEAVSEEGEEPNNDDSEEKITQALKDEGYSESEIAYIVRGHHSPTYDESKEAKAHATYAMADVETDHAKKAGEVELQANQEASKTELEAKKKQMELEHGHASRMKDLEYQHAQMQSPDPETEKGHKKRMLDLEYENAKSASPDGSDKEHQKRMMDIEYQNALAGSPDPEIQKQMAQMDLEERKLQLEQRKAEMKMELEFKKKEHELKLKHAEQLAAKKLKEKLAEKPAPKKKLKKSFDLEDGIEESQDE